MPEMPDLNAILEAAQNAQAELQKAQDSLDKIEVEVVAGGGLVRIRATAKGRILAVDIDESLLNPSEKTMVEDLIAAAINDGIDKTLRLVAVLARHHGIEHLACRPCDGVVAGTAQDLEHDECRYRRQCSQGTESEQGERG